MVPGVCQVVHNRIMRHILHSAFKRLVLRASPEIIGYARILYYECPVSFAETGHQTGQWMQLSAGT